MDFFHPREPVSTWTHAAGVVLAVLGTGYLWSRSRGCRPSRRLSLLIFGLSLMFCYSASTLFHDVRGRAARIAVFDRLDRVGIFVLIAGTYTPLSWILLRGWWRRCSLTAVWSITAVASGLLACGGPLSPAWMTGLYLAMGWGVIACYAELARVVSHRALLPLVAGGVFYSVGAVLNVFHWPVLRAGVFEAHEVFHLFVLAGSLSHYTLVVKVAVPFEHPPAPPRPPAGQRSSPHSAKLRAQATAIRARKSAGRGSNEFLR